MLWDLWNWHYRVKNIQNSSNKPSSCTELVQQTKSVSLQNLVDKTCTRSAKKEQKQKKWRRERQFIYYLRICTLSTKLRNFQFEFLHSKIATKLLNFQVQLNFRNQISVAFGKEHKKRCFIFSGNARSRKPFGIVLNNFFVSADLLPASQVLTICQSLDLKGEKSASLLNHCLLLVRCYIWSSSYKNVRPSSIEYAHQVRCNLITEKHVSFVTRTKNVF